VEGAGRLGLKALQFFGTWGKSFHDRAPRVRRDDLSKYTEFFTTDLRRICNY
jgi:hypothetical protein